MNILIISLQLFLINCSFCLTNDFNNDELLKEKGIHFKCVIPGIGTLIHPQWCITAAHNRPGIGQSFQLDNEQYFVEKVVVHPFYEIISVIQHNFKFKYEELADLFPIIDPGYDLALIKLNQPVLTRPCVGRETDDQSRSSRNWVVSGKDGILKAGCVQLCNLPEDVYYKSWTQETIQPLISKRASLLFYNFNPNFDNKQYTFHQTYNSMLTLSGLLPKKENSKLAVKLEDNDSGSPTFNFSSLYENSIPDLNDIKLTGIIVSRLKDPNSLKPKEGYVKPKNGHMGIVLRLPHSGLNEFIDHIILKDALGTNVNALVNMLTLQQALKDDFRNQPDLTNPNTKIAYGLPAFLINTDTLITPQQNKNPIYLKKNWLEKNIENGKFIPQSSSFYIKKSVTYKNHISLISAPKTLLDFPIVKICTVCYSVSDLNNLPIDFDYYSIKNSIFNK